MLVGCCSPEVFCKTLWFQRVSAPFQPTNIVTNLTHLSSKRGTQTMSSDACLTYCSCGVHLLTKYLTRSKNKRQATAGGEVRTLNALFFAENFIINTVQFWVQPCLNHLCTFVHVLYTFIHYDYIFITQWLVRWLIRESRQKGGLHRT